MEMLKFAEVLGKRMIEGQHNFFSTGDAEHLEHITNIKRIIVSISEFLSSEGLSDVEINNLADNLRLHARSGYLEACVSNKNEDEDDDVVCDESVVLFDYIYENEKYPE
jgi:hypothetical protein